MYLLEIQFCRNTFRICRMSKNVFHRFKVTFFLSDMSRNKLTELPSECTDFNSMERLILYHNTIRAIPDSVSALQSLQFLDLRYV